MDFYRGHTLLVIVGYNNRPGGFYAVQKILFYGNAAFLYVAYSHRALGNAEKCPFPEINSIIPSFLSLHHQGFLFLR